jgi:hypothetical protein
VTKLRLFIPRDFIQDIFNPDINAIPESDRHIITFSSKKLQSKKMSSQQKWHMMTCHPRNFIPEASYGMYEEFFIQEIGWLYIGKTFWYGKVISFILTTVYSPNETVFIHPFCFSSRSIVIRWIIKVQDYALGWIVGKFWFDLLVHGWGYRTREVCYKHKQTLPVIRAVLRIHNHGFVLKIEKIWFSYTTTVFLNVKTSNNRPLTAAVHCLILSWKPLVH